MSIYLTPSAAFEAITDTGETGLVGTIGLLIQDNQGTIVQAFSAAVILETPAGSGVYAATRNAPVPVGQYSIVWTRGPGGDVLGVEDLFVNSEVLSQTLPVIPDDFPFGPCSTWVTGENVSGCCTAFTGDDTTVLDDVAFEASTALYEASGRLFNGVCQRTVRPCSDGCTHWSDPTLGLNYPWFWAGAQGGAVWGWRNEAGQSCGCEPLSRVRLAGYPVREIVEVKIDGVVLDEIDGVSGNRNWRLDGRRNLIRMGDPGPPYAAQKWPGCQNLDLDDTEASTFAVTYTYGTGPPRAGVAAACQLACQLWLACNGQPCSLPVGATKVTRQGVQIERGLLANFLDPSQPTGLIHLDLFLRAYAESGKPRRRSAVWTPDMQPFARKVGNS